MSILIRGMEMPKTCEACDFCHWSNLHQTGICDRCDDEPVCMDYGTDYRRGRASFCPLIEVPTLHGDLIDLSDMVHPNDSMRLMTIDEQLERTCEGWNAKKKEYVVIKAEGSEE